MGLCPNSQMQHGVLLLVLMLLPLLPVLLPPLPVLPPWYRCCVQVRQVPAAAQAPP